MLTKFRKTVDEKVKIGHEEFRRIDAFYNGTVQIRIMIDTKGTISLSHRDNSPVSDDEIVAVLREFVPNEIKTIRCSKSPTGATYMTNDIHVLSFMEDDVRTFHR